MYYMQYNIIKKGERNPTEKIKKGDDIMKLNITDSEKKELEKIWSEVLTDFPEGTEKDMMTSIEKYVDENGIPETDEHDALIGDELEEYLGKGLNFEDCRTIIED